MFRSSSVEDGLRRDGKFCKQSSFLAVYLPIRFSVHFSELLHAIVAGG